MYDILEAVSVNRVDLYTHFKINCDFSSRTVN
jgi:hypothetical protein